ncbi:hypothetical protein RSOLAG1IB_01786 [Rhizoctonia solani AG-1 IB]|uniref:Uncharacterized protein n=1 Tax=Thanatephorus cucumeris (strain AG1-IB / isolate 7/3/14) TaxID=1108050 RepID=A0A0B7FFU2_THACB|nr:hypothetical protein RSOLAG1IB_01786 [Rhizoctonia solani AG-1 IB]
MAERAPVAYPNPGTSQINFSLPLRLAHKRPMSLLSIRSPTRNQLEVPCSTRSRVVSAPASPAYRSGTTSIHPSGSDSIRLPVFPILNLRPRTVCSSRKRHTPPQLQLDDQWRFRTDSFSSTTTSSLEASLAELEELIEVLSTPTSVEEGLFVVQSDSKSGTKFEHPKDVTIMPGNETELVQRYEPGPRWI